MESEAGSHVVHAWKQAVCRGNALVTKHVRRQLGIHKVEVVGEE